MTNEYLVCPKCKSDEIDTCNIQKDFNIAYNIATCISCGFRWRECYKFSHNETLDDFPKRLDENGNIVENTEDQIPDDITVGGLEAIIKVNQRDCE